MNDRMELEPAAFLDRLERTAWRTEHPLAAQTRAFWQFRRPKYEMRTRLGKSLSKPRLWEAQPFAPDHSCRQMRVAAIHSLP